MGVTLTMYFQMVNGTRTTGWSENVNFAYTDITSAIAGVSESIVGYIPSRLAMLGAGVTNTYNRFTLTSPGPPPIPPFRRQVQPTKGTTPYISTTAGFSGLAYYNPGYATSPADFAGTVALLRFQTAATGGLYYTRSFWLAGIPDDQDQTNIPFGTANLNNQIGSFINALFRFNINVRTIDRSSANPLRQCSAYNPTLNQYTVPNANWTNGQLVEALGWKVNPGSPVPRGQYRITVVQTGNPLVFSLNGAQPISSLKTLGNFRLVSYFEGRVVGGTFRGFSQKKHGRPFGLAVGRRLVPRIVRA
jgi:hypothetical protein